MQRRAFVILLCIVMACLLMASYSGCRTDDSPREWITNADKEEDIETFFDVATENNAVVDGGEEKADNEDKPQTTEDERTEEGDKPIINKHEEEKEEDYTGYSGVKNIILIIGDGMGFEHIEAGEFYSGKHYTFTDWCQTKVNTNSLLINSAVVTTDSAASATAMATGKLTVNGFVGTNYTYEEFTTILDIAKEKGKRTGIVTNGKLFEATPAGFSAHCLTRHGESVIIKSQIKSGVDLLCGKYDKACIDARNEIEAEGYTFCDDFACASGIVGEEKAYCQFDMGGNCSDVPLQDATAFALDFLSEGDEGFVLVVEQAFIDTYNHDNNFDRMIECVASLNKTVEYVTEWVGDRDDTAIFVTADHESGDLEVSFSNEGKKTGEYTNENGTIYYTWGRKAIHTNKEVGFFSNVEVEFERFSSLGSGETIKNIDIFTIMNCYLQHYEESGE